MMMTPTGPGGRTGPHVGPGRGISASTAAARNFGAWPDLGATTLRRVWESAVGHIGCADPPYTGSCRRGLL